MISWRNPDARHRDWGVDVYGQAILDALDAALAVTGADAATLLGCCSGGTLQSMALAALQQRGQLDDKVAGFALAVCVLDQAQAGVAGALLDEHHRQGRVRRVRRPRLPGRAHPGRALRLAAPERPDLELLGEQLPAGQGPGGVRHPVLERRHHPHERGTAPRVPRPRPAQRAGPARGGEHARRTGGPVVDHHRRVRRRRCRRPHLPVAGVLPQRAALRRRHPLRAVHQRAHRRDRQPAHQRQGDPPGLHRPRRRRHDLATAPPP